MNILLVGRQQDNRRWLSNWKRNHTGSILSLNTSVEAQQSKKRWYSPWPSWAQCLRRLHPSPLSSDIESLVQFPVDWHLLAIHLQCGWHLESQSQTALCSPEKSHEEEYFSADLNNTYRWTHLRLITKKEKIVAKHRWQQRHKTMLEQINEKIEMPIK